MPASTRARPRADSGPWVSGTVTVQAPPTLTPEPTATPTPDDTPTATPEPTATATPDPTPTATATPTPTATPAPNAVSGLTIDVSTGETMVVSWTAPSNRTADDYRVNWAKSGVSYPSWDSEEGNLHPASTSVRIGGLEAGATYNVRVRARFDQSSRDAWSGPWAETTSPAVTAGSGETDFLVGNQNRNSDETLAVDATGKS